MDLVCLDMEGVLTPEIWIEFSKASGIPELSRTTRDEPDYDKLMKWRLGVLKEHGLGIQKIREVIAGMEPLPGAKEFLDRLRARKQVVILSDTFEEFALPLLEKLGRPVLFANSLVIAEDGEILDYRMRVSDSKRSTVRALKTVGFEIIAAGDSFNDLGMIREAKKGFFFRTTDALHSAYPEVPAFEEYDDLLAAILSE